MPPTDRPPAAADGTRTPTPRFDTHGWPTNEFPQDVHSGAVFGMAGQWLDLLTGIVFVVLSTTGPAMYFQMLRARRKTGQTQAFWRRSAGLQILNLKRVTQWGELLNFRRRHLSAQVFLKRLFTRQSCGR